MLEAAKDLLLKTLGALLPILLGWFYKPEWIDSRIKLRVDSEGDGVTVQGGELPYLRIWFHVTNLSPFTIELDRVITQMQLRGRVIGEFSHLHKHIVKPSSEERFLLEGSLGANQLEYLERQEANHYPNLYLTVYANCRVHSLVLKRNAQTTSVRYLNCAFQAKN